MANAVFYTSLGNQLFQGGVDHLTDTLMVLLLKDTYSFDGNAHTMLNHIISHEVTGINYTSLGKVLASKSLSVDTVNSRVCFLAANVSWLSSTITDARYAVVYKYSGDPITSPLLYLFDFGENKSSGGGDFILQWDSVGIAYLKGI